ncbi:MAG: chitobiase/beta-hexosaminidase C-terminal domain-containing protein [Paludibacteraceae bacterium]
MRTKFTLLLFFLFVGLSVCRATLPEGYTMVTNISALEDGDHVVLYSTTISLGVTGWDGNTDATVGTSGWAEYKVEVSQGGVYLKDTIAGKYISNPASTTFAYSDTPMLCTLGTSNRFKCGSRYLCQSPITGGYAYRFYTSSTGSYKPFFLYKVPVVSTTIAVPTLLPAEGAVAADGSFTAPFLLTIHCGTEGAQIYYTTDGTDPVSSESRVLYLSPLTISETTTLRVIATDGTNNSKEVKVTYILKKGYAESIAEFIAEASTTAFELRLTQAQAAIIIGITSVPQHIYLQDKSGKGIILHTQGVDLPDGVGTEHQIVGSIYGTLGDYEGNPRIENIQLGEDIAFPASARPQPVVVQTITDTTYARYPLVLVTIEDVVFNEDGKICKEGTKYTCRNDFHVLDGKALPNSTTQCRVTGITSQYYGLYNQIIPVIDTDIDTQGALATLPTFSPVGGETPEDAVKTERVTITPATNTTVWIDDVRHAYEFELPITQSLEALTLTAKRDFYSDNTITLWYQSSQPPISTAVYPVTDSKTKPHKAIVNNQLFIIYGNGVYNAQGMRVR